MWLTISTGNTQELPNPTYDLMHWIQEAPDDHSIVLNSWDWEFLRQQFEKLPSTGPTGPFLWWRNLEGHDLLPILAVGKNEDGRQLVVGIGGDRALYYRREGQLEGSWDPWSSLGGKELQQPVRVAVGATGEVVVFVLGGDRKVYCRSQVGPNGAWADWTNIGGEGIRGDFAVARNTDGRLEIVAVWNDGALHNVSQSAPDGSWGAWSSRGGHDLAGAVGLAAKGDGRLAAFAVGGGGVIYYQWQLNVNGQTGWSDWNTLNKIEKNVTSLPKSERVLVIGGNDGRLYVFLMKN